LASRVASASPMVPSRFTSAVRLVAHVLHGEYVYADAHSLQVHRSFRGQLLCEARAVAVDLLHGQGAKNRAEVAFQCLKDDPLDLLVRHAQEALGRGTQREIIALDLDVGDSLHRDRHALQCVGALDFQRDSEDV